jgi:hypothetical protein
MKRPLCRELSSLLVAAENCRKAGNTEWLDKHEDRIEQLVKELPSGSGIDCGTKLVREKCTPHKLVFAVSFHHMNDVGMYDGWTEHVVTVTPSFDGIDIHISGRNRNNIKDYLADTYHDALTTEIELV